MVRILSELFNLELVAFVGLVPPVTGVSASPRLYSVSDRFVGWMVGRVRGSKGTRNVIPPRAL